MERIISALVVVCLCGVLFIGANNQDYVPSNTNDLEVPELEIFEENEEADDVILEDTEEVTETVLDEEDIDPSKFYFKSTDRDGNPIKFTDFKDSKLILINMWEPWCGPCVAEMPDLENLYQNYKDKGFLIIGLYDTLDMEEDTEKILSEANITYPIVAYDENIYKYATGYVPTSFFVSPEGDILSKEAIIGANSYEDWEALVLEYLE